MHDLIVSEPEALLNLGAPLRALPGHVHAWAFTLDASPQCAAGCRALLSQEEAARASRFVFARDRERYVVAHGVLRRLLGLYSGLPAREVAFATEGAAGKPRLAADAAAATLSFNLSHSHGRALLAVSDGRAVGADLEQLRKDVEVHAISSRYFFGAERDAIAQAPDAAAHETFFRYWVAKEAVLKAQGLGLGFPLDRFRVVFLPENDRARIETFDAPALHDHWIVRMLRCQPGWHAAVSAEGSEWAVRCEPRP
jgi:4'-phosphopantetheinyl transferase